MKIDFKTVIPKFDAILERGLCSGVGKRDGQMCIEAAICAALDLPHSDKPSCVASAVRSYKIALNDQRWSSPQARAKGLRDIGIAQIGSKGVVDDKEFAKRLADKTARVLIPTLFREIFHKPELLAVADRCAKEGSTALSEARRLATTAYATDAAAYADAYAAAYADAYAAAAAYATAADAAADATAYAADATAYAADATDAAAYADAYAADAADAAADAADADATISGRADKYLLLSASLALEVLRELKSPGCEWIGGVA